MGCGGIRAKIDQKLINDDELYKEAFKDAFKKLKGLNIDDLTQITTHKVLNSNNPIFKEEIVDHADESGSVKPWIANIVPPEIEIVENKDTPAVNLKIEHVFGFRSYDVRQNLFFSDRNHICYMTGAMGVVQNTNDLSQRIFGGLASNDEGDCHDDDIVSIAIHLGEVSMIATGQRHLKPSIMIWSPLDPSVIFSIFHQSKGTKEVSKLAFDKKGEHIASVGIDPMNSFFVFNIESNSLSWKGESGSNKIFDIQFNPLGDEFCIVGINTVQFLYLSRKMKKDALVKNQKYSSQTFTAVCYTKNGIAITSTANGNILIWEDCVVVKDILINSNHSTLHNLTYSYVTDRIYISDANKFVYVGNLKKEMFISFEIEEKFLTHSVVKALDVNCDGEFALGMRDGTILIKKGQNERVITRSHFEGAVSGLEFIPEVYIITTGCDNRVMLWNINTKICEEIGILNEKPENSLYKTNQNKNSTPQSQAQIQEEIILSQFADNQCSQCVCYNSKFDHVAIGLNNGKVSIRKGLRKLNEKLIEDVVISNIGKEIVNIKYSPNMRYLAASSTSNEFYLLNIESMYLISHKFKGHDDFVTQFDWDVTSRYLQAVTEDNYYFFYDKETEEKVKGQN